MRIRSLLTVVLALALLPGCGGGRDERGAEPATSGATSSLSGRIEADGSSTVGPLTTAAAERFQRENPDVRITVGVSGTGGGFERFCRGETDLSNASRGIEDDEKQLCEKNGVEFTELQVANDALTVVVSRDNDWAECLTVEQLKAIWSPDSKIDTWKDLDAKFPDERLRLAGPGTDSGTFDYFTDVIVGEEGASRTDYTASENDNVIAQAVAGEKGALGYFGFSYFEENKDKLEALAVDPGEGCVAPSVETAQNGTYKPLSRPLFVYAKRASLERPEVEAFLRYLVDNEKEIAEAARFVPLTGKHLAEAEQALGGE